MIFNFELASRPDNFALNWIFACDFNEAKCSFERAVQLDENDTKSWWMLSSLTKARNNGIATQLVDKMKLTKPYPMPHAYLGYAAGKLFEDTESWKEAFVAFEQGAQGKRKTVEYSSIKAQQTFEAIKRSKKGAILLDDDYVDGISNSLANRINLKTGKKIYTMGLKDKTAGAHAKVDNLPPSAKEIVKKVTRILNEKK